MNCYAKNFNNELVCSNKLQVLYDSTSGIMLYIMQLVPISLNYVYIGTIYQVNSTE